MDFVAIVDQVITLLRQRGRMTYRTLQRQFQLDEEALADLLAELRYAYRDEPGGGARRAVGGRGGRHTLSQRRTHRADRTGATDVHPRLPGGTDPDLPQRPGKRAQAGDWAVCRRAAALATAIALYRGMEMTFWLPQAEAVLAQVG
jgi:hypothetical protein